MISGPARFRVKAGMAWLSERRPKWRDDINLNTLDLANPSTCVLGQVANAINRAVNGAEQVERPDFATIVDCNNKEYDNNCVLDLLGMTERMSQDFATSLGFEVADGESYRELDTAWKDALTYG